MSKLTPGQPLSGNLKAGEFNRHVDVAEWYHRHVALGDPSQTFASAIPTDIVKVKNFTGGDLLRGSVVEVGTKTIDALDRAHLWFRGETPDLSRQFGILLVPVPDGEYGWCQIAGECLAKVNVTNVLHRHAIVQAGSTTLQSATSGPVRLTQVPTATGTQELGVRLFEEPRVEPVNKTTDQKDATTGFYPGQLIRADPLTKTKANVQEIWVWDLND